MINALDELLEELNGLTIVAATIHYETSYEEIALPITLVEGHTPDSLTLFKERLEQITYDNGYGRQYLYGTVWLGNNIWLERHEYDGSEWWVKLECPEIPFYLKAL